MLVKEHEVEFLEEEHIYLVDGVITPSITQIMKKKFKNKYNGISQEVLKRAADKGTAIHKAIEEYDKLGIESDYIELKNYKVLKRLYQFKTIDNEKIIILFKKDKPIACGTLDLLIEEKGKIGIADIKRTSVLDKEYLGYQLNLYRIAYQQCFDKKIEFLRGIHLRNDTRKYIEIPINEQMAWELVEEYLNGGIK